MAATRTPVRARIPQGADLNVQVAIQDINDTIEELRRLINEVKEKIPNPKDIEALFASVSRLSKTPTYLDPNDVFRGSGPAHMHGYVPDPGKTPGTTKFLCEDGTWRVP